MVCYPNLTLSKTYSNFFYKSCPALYGLLGSKGREAKFYGYIIQIFHYLFSHWLIVQIMHHDSKSKGKIENTIMTQTNLSCDNSWSARGYVLRLKIKIASLKFLTMIWIGNSMICSDIFHKYHECDISKLSNVISRAVRRVKFETILKYHEWYLCQMLPTNHAIINFCSTTETLENIT